MVSTITAIGSAVAVLAAGLFGAAPPPTAVAAASHPGIEVVAVNGSGCPAGTADVQSAPEGSAVLVTFRQFTARAGGGTPAAQQRKNCQIILQGDDPEHWSFALESSTAIGRLDIGRNAVALHQTIAYFAGGTAETRTSHSWNGPRSGTWQNSGDFPSPLFSPCGAGRNLNVNTEIRLQSALTERTSWMELDAVFLYPLLWRRC